jgi:uncharacterized protein GlcG (DUF336 family)
MTTPHTLTLAEATTLIDHALATGRAERLKPLAVAVVNAGGQLIAFKREDQSSLLRSDIAIGKAWAVMATGLGARALIPRMTANPHFYNALAANAAGKMVPGIGGVLVRDAQGEIVGAVGVSGDTADNDERCAVAGIRHVAFHADTGAV